MEKIKSLEELPIGVYSVGQHCSHICKGPHGSKYSEQFKLMCHTICPSKRCNHSIKYGEITEHLRECHSNVKSIR